MWNEVLKNTSIVLSGVIVSRFFIFLFNMIIIRQLSVEEYAHFAFAFSVFNWVLVFSHFDLYAAVSHRISYLRALGKTCGINQYYDHARLLSSFFSIIGVLVAFLVAGQKSYGSVMLFVFMCGLIPVSQITINDGYLKGVGRFRDASVADAVNGFSKFFFICIGFLFIDKIRLNHIFCLFFSSTVLSYVCSSGLVSRYVNIYKGERFVFEMKSICSLVRFSRWVCLTDLMNTGVLLSGNMILANCSVTDLACFNLVVLIYSVFQIGFGSITTVLIPQVSNKIARKEDFELLGWGSLNKLILVTAVFIFLVMLFPFHAEVLEFFFNKSEYSKAFSYLCILLVAFPFRVISVTNKGVLQGMGRPDIVAKVSIITLIVNISLFIFLYSWWGLVGIFVAMTFSYIVEFLLIMISAERNQSGKIGPVPEIINY